MNKIRMIQNFLLRRFFRNKIPEIRRPEDFIDERATKLIKENLMRVAELPGYLYILWGAGGEINFDLKELQKMKSPPIEYFQFITGAIINYELTKRPIFKIECEESIEDTVIRLTTIIERKVSKEKHELSAMMHEINSEELYKAYANATGQRIERYAIG